MVKGWGQLFFSRTSRVWIGALAFSLGLDFPQAYSLDAVPNLGIGTLYPTQSAPPAFDIARLQTLSTLQSPACLGLSTTMAQGVASGLGFSPNGANGGSTSSAPAMCSPFPMQITDPCMDPISVAPNSNIDCSMLNQQAFNARMAEINRVRSCGFPCRMNQLGQADAKARCAVETAQGLMAQASALTNYLRGLMQGNQTYVQKLNDAKADRENQSKFIQAKLKGDPATGKKGLYDTKKAVTDMLSNLEGSKIPQMKAAWDQLEQATKVLDENIQSRKIAMTNNCFSTFKVASPCTPNGPAESFKDSIKCQVRNRALYLNGRPDYTAPTLKAADAKAMQFENLISQIFADSPTDAKLPSSEAEAKARMDQSVRILNPKQIEKLYGSQLASLNVQGFSVYQEVMKAVNTCFNRSENLIAIEKTKAVTPIGAEYFKLKQEGIRIDGLYKQLVTETTTEFQTQASNLSNRPSPLNVASCNRSDRASRESCLSGFTQQMHGLLKGGTEASKFMIEVPGAVPGQAIVVAGSGLNQQVSYMETLHDKVAAEVVRLDTNKRSYVQQANTGLEQFIQQANEKYLNPLSAKIMQDFNAVRGVLGQFNQMVGAVPTIMPELLKQDKDGLYQAPANALAMIGGQTTPRLPDVSAGGFAELQSRTGQAMARLNDQLRDIQTAQIDLEAKFSRCRMDAESAATREIASLINAAKSARCGLGAEICEQSNQDERAKLQSELVGARIIGNMGATSDLASARNGIRYLCRSGPTVTGAQQNMNYNTTDFSTCDSLAGDIRSKLSELKNIQFQYGSQAGGARR